MAAVKETVEAVAALDVGAIARTAREPRLIPERIRAARIAAIKTQMRTAGLSEGQGDAGDCG